jgi:hypothetical protein
MNLDVACRRPVPDLNRSLRAAGALGWTTSRFREYAIHANVYRKHRGDLKTPCRHRRRFLLVRPAGRTHLEVKVLCSPDKGKS